MNPSETTVPTERLLVKVFVQVGHGNLVKFGEGPVLSPRNVERATVTLLRETADSMEAARLALDNDVLRKYGEV